MSTDIWAPKQYSNWEWILRTWIGPAIILIICPFYVNVSAYAVLYSHGSIYSLLFQNQSFQFSDAFVQPSSHIIKTFFLFFLFEFLLLLILPGKTYYGPISPTGERPVHKRNGDKAFLLTIFTFLFLVQTKQINGSIIYDELLGLLSLLNGFAMVFSFLLFFKGLYFPSTKDHGSNENYLFRFYEGEELYPAIFGIDLKNFVITRLGMIGWSLFTLSFTFASYREHNYSLTYPLLGSVILNFSYVFKFFLFYEEGYMSAGDIAIDRFGFMLSYGTMCFMPLVHNLQTLHLVQSKGLDSILNGPISVFCWVMFGYFMIFLNYDSDTQKFKVREANGNIQIWGKPCEYIRAEYVTKDGKKHESLLVLSGYYGISRHFHYLPDIILLFLYCAPAGFEFFLPHTYFVYLTCLLLDRTFRIDQRCGVKYGKYWKDYTKRVPYRLIPGLF